MTLHEFTSSLLYDESASDLSDVYDEYTSGSSTSSSTIKKKKKKRKSRATIIFAIKILLVIVLCVTLIFGVIMGVCFLAYSGPTHPELICTYSADALYTTEIVSTGATHAHSLRLHSLAPAADGSAAPKHSSELVSAHNGTRGVALGDSYYVSTPFFDRRLCTKGYGPSACPSISSLATRAKWTAPCPSDSNYMCSVYTRSWDNKNNKGNNNDDSGDDDDSDNNETWYVFPSGYGDIADGRVLSGYYLRTGDTVTTAVFTNYTFAAPDPSHFEFEHSGYCYDIHDHNSPRFAYSPVLGTLVPTPRAHDLINSPAQANTKTSKKDKIVQGRHHHHHHQQQPLAWTRGDNPCFDGLTYADMRQRLTDVFTESPSYDVHSKGSYKPIVSNRAASIPESFDCESRWPHCESLGAIRDQGGCGACWAFGVAEVLADRTCIATGANLTLSPQYLMDCVSRRGCLGWASDAAWAALAESGTTTEGCTPYEGRAALCADKCADGSQRVVHRSRDAHSIYAEGNFSETVRLIQLDIMENGPVAASIFVYDDLYRYRGGVYYHGEEAAYVGKHVVKIVGWGVDENSGLPYWRVANSWSSEFGENGYFRILRGRDESGIEYGVSAGYPAI